MIIGIDLGTTYSVIAVFGEVKAQGNYPEFQYFPESNITLIPDPDGSFAIPSAFWCNPNNPDEKEFGYDAKELSKEGKTPILFSKRSIGTTEILKIGEKEFTAKEVATEYLKYLKKCAEIALGQPVKRAVITHPAYFSLNQVEETKQAAIDAGFDMSDNEQMLMEPIAAATTFIAADPREELTILAYDLGGGTFDATVIEKKYGVITAKAFDGNHLLGGYNFDKKFLSWLLGRVHDSFDRTIEITEDNISDQSCWSRLLQIAEKIKIELTNKPTSRAPVPISINDVLFDTDGKSIQIIDRINREEYTALIADLLEDTIERTNNAIQKAGITKQEIDLIILVGGSSHGQWVKEAVKKAFPENEVMQHDSPDLVVAMGAALISEQLSSEDNGSESESGAIVCEYLITVDIPSKSLLPSLHFFGSVCKSNGDKIISSQMDEFYLMIQPDDSNNGAVKLNEDGIFIFRDVELLYDEVTNFSIELYDNHAVLINKRNINIEYVCDGIGSAPTQAIPKTLLTNTTDNNGVAELPVENAFPLINISDIYELKDKFEKLEDKRQEEIYNERNPARRGKLGSGDKIAKKIKLLLSEEGIKDCQEINLAIKELENLFVIRRDEFEPPLEEFNKLIAECENLIKAKSDLGDNQIENYDKLDRIKRGRDEAQLTRNRRRWSYTFELLVNLYQKLKSQTHPQPSEWKIPELKDALYDDIVVDLNAKLKQEIKRAKAIGIYKLEIHDPREEKINKQINELKERIELIPDDTKPEIGIAKMQSIRREKYKVEKSIETLFLDCSTQEGNYTNNQNKIPFIGIDLGTTNSVITYRGPENNSRFVPTSRIDNVHFSVSSPPAVKPGKQIIVDVWAHLEQQRAEVANRVQQASIPTEAPPVIRPKGPFKIERGTMLYVRLKFQDLIVEPAEDVILWEGEIGNTSFVVSVPAEVLKGMRIGSVTVHCAGGFQIARIPLQLLIADEVVHTEPIEQTLHRVRKAFVSYARVDLDEVLSRIQGMQKIMPDLDVFLDVVKLRSGEDWEKRLWSVIPESDVFYLFWSAAAKESTWVEKEWRCALTSRGVDFIDPVPLVSPKDVPPPEELSKMHFNDWSLAYRRGKPEISM